MLLGALIIALCGQALPVDAPRADLDRSLVTGKTKEWLAQEILRVEAARPSAGWYAGSLSLIPIGLLSVLVGFFVYELERCGLFQNTCTRFPPPQAASVTFWATGGAFVLTGAFLTGLIAHQRAPGSQRLDALRRALLALGPPWPADLERFDPPQEAPSRSDW